MSLESGRKLGLISSIIFVVLPIISIVALTGFILSIISSVQIGTSTSTIPPGILGLSAGLLGTYAIIGILGLVGFILFILAMYYLSHYYNEPGIFKNILYAIRIMIVTGVAVLVAEFAFLIPSIGSLSQLGTSAAPSSFFGQFFVVFIVIILVAVVMSIVSAVLVMRAFNKLGEKSEVDSFKTAGLLYLIGVLLSIIAIGAIIAWIAFIFAAIGFYRLKPAAAIPAVSYPTEPAPTAIQTKRCPYCATENKPDAAYCRFCGKSLQ
jgi:uncharacterized membrane protein